jgi:hypothetical protein
MSALATLAHRLADRTLVIHDHASVLDEARQLDAIEQRRVEPERHCELEVSGPSRSMVSDSVSAMAGAGRSK